MSIPSLQTLCLLEVVEHIWRNSHLSDALLEVAEYTKRKCFGEDSIGFQQELKKANRKYQKIIKEIIEIITTSEYIPTKLKLKIALYVMRLENDALKTILDIRKQLSDPTKENIAYCIDKLVFTTDCTVDRTETILTIWRHSFMNIEISTYNIERFCLLSTDMLYDLMFTMLSCSCDKKEMKKKISDVITSLQGMDFYRDLKEEAMYNFYPNSDSAHPYPDSLTFMYIMIYKCPDMFRYLYEKAPFAKKQQKLVAATVGVLSSEKQNSVIQENMIYSYKVLPDKMFLKILIRFYKSIYKKMFFGIFSSTCVEFFNLLWKSNHLKICSDILLFTSELLASQVPKTCYKNIIYANSKYTFMDMWSQAPDSVKLLLGEGFNDMMDCVLKTDDVQLLSILLNDNAFSYEEKLQHYIHLFSRLALPSNKDKIKEITEEAGFDINEIINKMTIDDFKKILLKICETQCYFEDLEKDLDEKVLINFKVELTKDKQFMIDMIIAILLTSDAENNMQYCFRWLFNNNETVAQQYVQKYLASGLWLADLYKKYLLITANKSTYPNTDIFKYLNVSEDVQNEVKEITRNDEKLVFKLCEKYTARKFCKISKLLSCLFDNDVKKEQSFLKLQFLVSKRGQKVIYQLFKSDYYNTDWYMSYQFRKVIRHYFHFHKQWLGNDKLVRVGFKQLLNNLPHPNSVDIEEFNHLKIKRPTKRIPLFYSENVRQNRLIVDANYRMFRNIISLPYEYRDRASDHFDEDMYCPLTEWTQMFTSKWLIPVHVPVVV